MTIVHKTEIGDLTGDYALDVYVKGGSANPFVLKATVTTYTDTTHFKTTDLTGYGDDYFGGPNNNWYVYAVRDVGGAGALPQGESELISDYVSSDGTFTHVAFTTPLAAGDEVLIVHEWAKSTAGGDATAANQTLILADIGDASASTQIRRVASGIKAINSAATKYLSIDSGTNGAEIIGIAIKGVVSADWTLDVYVPTADAVAAPAAGDKRDTNAYVNTDAEGGMLSGFAIPYNCFLDFTNDSAGADNIDDVVILYRSSAVLTLAWEA